MTNVERAKQAFAQEKARQSWLAEFYPEDARDAANSDLEALDHSLQKWTGFRKENLEKHGLIADDDRYLSVNISTRTCALCQRYVDKSNICDGCPLWLELEGNNCYEDSSDGASPYHAFIRGQDPEPMIQLIQICLDKEKARLAEKKERNIPENE